MKQYIKKIGDTLYYIYYLKVNEYKLEDSIELACQTLRVAAFIRNRYKLLANKVNTDFGLIDDDYANNKITLKLMFHESEG